ncbi:hypothetical protein NHF45_06690 [Maricaulaceae bacterium NA33B04]|nr:hypothetical protein [Maricaulaceae bacterium NA33B04]
MQHVETQQNSNPHAIASLQARPLSFAILVAAAYIAAMSLGLLYGLSAASILMRSASRTAEARIQDDRRGGPWIFLMKLMSTPISDIIGWLGL